MAERVLVLAMALPERASLQERLDAKLPNLGQRMRDLGIEDVPGDAPRTVWATRWLAGCLLASVGDSEAPDVLDCEGVEIVSSAFMRVVLEGWPGIRLANANEDVQCTWDFVVGGTGG